MSDEQPFHHYCRQLWINGLCLALGVMTTAVGSAQASVGGHEWNSKYLTANAFPDRTLVLDYNRGTDITLYEDEQHQRPVHLSIGGEVKEESDIQPLYRWWPQDGAGGLRFLVKTQRGNMIEIYVEPTLKKTLWFLLPEKQSETEGKVTVTDFAKLYLEENTPDGIAESVIARPATVDLLKDPDDGAPLTIHCDAAPHGSANFLLLTGKRKGDWLEMQCEGIGKCYAENSGAWWAGCESNEQAEFGLAHKKNASSTLKPCLQGWARWRSPTAKVLLQITEDPRKSCD
jgi:hypothetical protein